MKTASLRTLAGLAIMAILSACGGGGGSAGDPLLGGGVAPTTAVSELSVRLDKDLVPNDGTAFVTATVTALDKNRVALKNVAVTFAVNANGVVKPGGTVTDDKGEIKAAVEIGSDRSNRSITLTASAGAVSKAVTFAVVDSTITVPTAQALSLQLDKRTVSNSGTDTVKVTVTATGAGGQAVAGIPVSFKVDGNANFVPSGTLTDSSGLVTAVVRIGDDKSNRVVNVTATSGTLTRTESFQVTGVKLSSSAVPSTLTPGSPGTVRFSAADVNGAPLSKVDVTVSAAGLPVVAGATDVNGLYVYRYTAPMTTGPLTFTATAAGESVEQAVLITDGSSTIPVVTTPVISVPVKVTATPTVLKTKTATTSQIKALFLGAGNAPIKNIRVRFDFNGASSSAYGSFAAGSSLVYSDAQGVATTDFAAGATESPTDGVIIRACWDYSDFAVGTCPNRAQLATMTVVASGQAVSIGTDDTIEEGATKLTYVKRFVVQVADSAGNPVGSQQVVPSVDLLSYGKGFYRWDALTTAWRLAKFISCANEDADRNGALEALEDTNGNRVLDPRKSDVTVSLVGSDKTSADGQVVLKIEYPKSHAGWVEVRIQAAADVRSPSAFWRGFIPVEASALKRETPPPAFVVSPYGEAISNSCSVAD